MFSALQGLLFEQVLQPVMFATALGHLLPDGFNAMGWLLVGRLFGGTPIQGWTSTVVIMLFLGGVQLLSLGVIGEYVGRIFEEVKHRPHYVVRERIGVAVPPAPETVR